MAIQIIDQSELGGEFEGYRYGSEVTLILEHEDRVGAGPRLHQHPYSETFVLRRGAALFTVGDERFEAVGDQLLVVSAFTPHKFEKIGDEMLESVHIHASDRFITEWLE
jgi:mannose-6-phosphate isomerase-like protein (cupin superfamily)